MLTRSGMDGSRGRTERGLGNAGAEATHEDAGASPHDAATATSATDDTAAAADRTAKTGAGDAGLPELVVGDKIGRFVVEETIGQGGMGVVLAAHDPDLDRTVALKLLRPRAWGELAHTRARARLLREARAMAKLSHPNVVTVHEVGTVGKRVYVAMERIAGCTLGDWRRAESRTWREIVDVFVQAGRGLAAAHAAGLVHRDFKPGNVLVGKNGTVQVTDFGLAGTTATAMPSETGVGRDLDDNELADAPLSVSLTQAGAVLGTPHYMAPEQHLRKPVDARADQYAFCVALYEALYGELPFSGDSYPQLAFRVCSGDPPTPPTDGDVPTWVRDIVLRGLQCSPDDRYASMNALLAALRSDPQAARRRRRRWAVISVGLLALAAVAVVGLRRRPALAAPCTGARERLGGVWDRDQRASIEAAFLATERPYAGEVFIRIAQQLDEYTEAWVEQWTSACRATRVDEVQTERQLDLRMACLDRDLAKLSALTALLAAAADQQVLDRAAEAVAGLPRLASCADLEGLSSAIAPPADAEARARVEQARRRLDEAEARYMAGSYEAGLELASELLEDAEAIGYQPLEAEVLFLLGRLQSASGKLEESEATLRDAVGIAARIKNDELHAKVWIELIYLLGYRLARHQEAMAIQESAEAAVTRAGNDPLLLARLLSSVAEVRRQVGDYDRARELFEKALAIREAEFGPDHLEVAQIVNNLGTVFFDVGKLAEAEELYQRALAIKIAKQGPAHPNTAICYNNLGMVADRMGKLAEAETYYRRAFEIWERALDPEHPRIATLLNNLGGVLLASGKREQAREHFQRALAIWEKSLGPDHPKIAYPLGGLGTALFEEGKYEEALPYFSRALSIWEKSLGRDHPHLGYPLYYLGACVARLGKDDDASSILERGLSLYRENPSPPAVVAEMRFELARVFAKRERQRKRAVELARQARAGFLAAGAAMDDRRAEVDAWLREQDAD